MKMIFADIGTALFVYCGAKKHQWGAEILESNSALSKGLIFPLWQYGNCEENGNRELEVIGNIFDNPELLEEGKL